MTTMRLLLLASCLLAAASKPHVTMEPQKSDVSTRLRGVSAVSARVAWASGAGGTVLRTTDGGSSWQARPIPGTTRLDFRDVDAISEHVAFALSIGPGEASRIYKTSDGGEHWMLQFANSDPDVFLDAMAFWDADRGVAVSDSVRGAFVILTTINGGRAWTRVPADRLPAALPNEGAFAASGTNVAVSGRNHVWIGTGASRVLRSADGGRSWKVAVAPIANGESSGIFSIAFRDATHGVVVGGDYKKEAEAVDNVATTSDGGVTWKLSTKGVSGYRSVVAWVPGTKQSFVAAGPSGMDWSSDDGRTWTAVESSGLDTLSFARSTGIGWGAGDRGRLARLSIQD
jgi:photosystem II stability/assembly factor-like uncharacterized protein